MTSADTPSPEALLELLDAVQPQGDESHVSIQDMLERVGGRSFAAVILVPSVLMVSPLSGILGTPTLSAIIIITCAVQAFLGRHHLWLPGFVTRRKISSGKLQKGVNWLRKPAGWMDRHSRGRLRFLTSRPLRPLAYLATIALAMIWPILELIPFVTSFGAGAVAMIMFGVMTRDGAYVLAGYIQGTVIYMIVISLWAGFL